MGAMAAYGDYETLCPQQTFTEASMRQNFPNTDLPAWEIIERFGPTEHGAEGFTVLIPEMDKVVLIFKGDYGLESAFPATSPPSQVSASAKTCAKTAPSMSTHS